MNPRGPDQCPCSTLGVIEEMLLCDPEVTLILSQQAEGGQQKRTPWCWYKLEGISFKFNGQQSRVDYFTSRGQTKPGRFKFAFDPALLGDHWKQFIIIKESFLSKIIPTTPLAETGPNWQHTTLKMCKSLATTTLQRSTAPNRTDLSLDHTLRAGIADYRLKQWWGKSVSTFAYWNLFSS